MAIIKSYTDLEQSRKLVEMLPIETADMFYDAGNDTQPTFRLHSYGHIMSNGDVPCWSLSALVNIIPKDESIDCAISFGYYNGKGEYIAKWLCSFEKEDETKDGFIIKTIDGDNPIDVLYEMILELNKLNML